MPAPHKKRGGQAQRERRERAEERERQRSYRIPPGGLDYWTMSLGRLVAIGEPVRYKGRRNG
ncbi:MAG: hypothetical protein ACYCX4_14360 [Bacillota bacterium]